MLLKRLKKIYLSIVVFTFLLLSVFIIWQFKYQVFWEKKFPEEIYSQREIIKNPQGKEEFINRIDVIFKENVLMPSMEQIISLVSGEITYKIPEIGFYRIKLLNCEKLFKFNKKKCIEEREKIISILRENPYIESAKETTESSKAFIQPAPGF